MGNVNPREVIGFDSSSRNSPFIFVSYSRSDAERIAPVLKHLNKNGIPVWYDAELNPVEKWLDTLLSIIESDNCKAVLLFISENSLSSQFVKAEVRHAFDNKKPIYGVYLEDVQLDREMNAYVRELQSTFMFGKSISEVNTELLKAAKRLMKGDAPTTNRNNYSNRVNDLLHEADMYFIHRDEEGVQALIGKAENIYRKVTEIDRHNCLGWLGLLKCRCSCEPRTPEEAKKYLAEAINYYNRVISENVDKDTEKVCSSNIDELWRKTLILFENVLNKKDEYKIKELKDFGKQLPNSSLLIGASPLTVKHYKQVKSNFENPQKILQADDLKNGILELAIGLLAYLTWAGILCELYYIIMRLFVPSRVDVNHNYIVGKIDFIAMIFICAISMLVLICALIYVGCYIAEDNEETKKSKRFNVKNGVINLLVASVILGVCLLGTYNGSYVVEDDVTYSMIRTERLNIDDYFDFEKMLERGVSIVDIKDGIVNVKIPETVEFQMISYPVVAVGALDIERGKVEAFANCEFLRKVELPDSVIIIGDDAFLGCTSLSEIMMSEKLRIIGKNAFADCVSLKTIIIPESVEVIKEDAFSGCSITIYAPCEAVYYGYTLDEGVIWIVQ